MVAHRQVELCAAGAPNNSQHLPHAHPTSKEPKCNNIALCASSSALWLSYLHFQRSTGSQQHLQPCVPCLEGVRTLDPGLPAVCHATSCSATSLA